MSNASQQTPQHINTGPLVIHSAARSELPPPSRALVFKEEAASLARRRSRGTVVVVACAPPPPNPATKSGPSQPTEWNSWYTSSEASHLLPVLGLTARIARSCRTSKPHSFRCVSAEAASVLHMSGGQRREEEEHRTGDDDLGQIQKYAVLDRLKLITVVP